MLPEPSGPSLILPTDQVTPKRHGNLDVYAPEQGLPAPCVLLVHGLYPEEPEVSPRDSRFYHDYASHLANRGVVAGVVEHDLTRGFLYHEALATVVEAIEMLRALTETDSDTVGLWFFSGGGPLCYPFLADPAPWLRCVELTYPVLPGADTPGWLPPDQVIAGIGSLPTYLTLVENEIPDFVVGQREFVAAAASVVSLDHRVVPGAGHGFDALQNEPHLRDAVSTGIDWMVTRLTEDT